MAIAEPPPAATSDCVGNEIDTSVSCEENVPENASWTNSSEGVVGDVICDWLHLLLESAEQNDAKLPAIVLQSLVSLLQAHLVLTSIFVTSSLCTGQSASANDMFVRTSALLTTDLMSAASFVFGIGIGISHMLAPRDCLREVLLHVIGKAAIDNIIGSVLCLVVCVLFELDSQTFLLDSIMWTLLDTVCHTSLSSLFNRKVLNPLMWMHYVFFNLNVSAYFLTSYAPHDKNHQAWLRSVSILRMSFVVVGFLMVAYLTTIVGGSDAHIFRTVISLPFIRVLESFAGIVIGWILCIHEDHLLQASKLSRPVSTACCGALGLCWLLDLGQPISAPASTPSCLRTIELPQCMSRTQLFLPRSVFLMAAIASGLLSHLHLSRRDADASDSAKSSLKMIDKNTKALDILMAGLALNWPTACGFVTLFRVMSIDVWMLSNAVAIPIVASLCGGTLLLYHTYAKPFLIQECSQQAARFQGVAMYSWQRLTCSTAP